MHEANPPSKVNPKGDPKTARNPEATSSDAAGYNLSQLKPEPSWVLIQAEPWLAEPILSALTLT